MDVLNSMLAEDFCPTAWRPARRWRRLLWKNAASTGSGCYFLGQAFTQCPITTDHRVVTEFLAKLRTDLFEEQGTAIGMGLASSSTA